MVERCRSERDEERVIPRYTMRAVWMMFTTDGLCYLANYVEIVDDVEEAEAPPASPPVRIRRSFETG